jgi:hypothetical protein
MAIEGTIPLTQSRQATLRTRLQKVGGIEARNLRIELRSGVSELAEFFSFSATRGNILNATICGGVPRAAYDGLGQSRRPRDLPCPGRPEI